LTLMHDEVDEMLTHPIGHRRRRFSIPGGAAVLVTGPPRP
jgi:hypothetical protein